ncbi:MAG: DUF5961 family protein [Caulobacteraceae bacterium]
MPEFLIYAGRLDRHHARLVTERSFEAAALAYLEDHPYDVEEDDELRVIVREVGSGHERCFRIDLDCGGNGALLVLHT